ncbi:MULTISPECIES: DUF6346 domain-containing protein [unclassified Plantactinospora]|uniref:DUF6346 domain-containing protein n=1 Tax=unclassified Plantactinospora TaxID=2631981 RepID=UPI000D171F68|nr:MULTISPECIES: DUF6346 domain-containing protein [unclassified Plantactinospora]AVT33977.1 hypothetical protein C6361_36175 [Plantactinospora sp. BC1]AVT40600.1 hypothetical protein C6W10_33760 [Plantactinospora sp. BB1]
MEPLDDRIAKRLAEIKEQERELDRKEAERNADVPALGAQVVQRKAGFLSSLLFTLGVLALAAGLLGVGVTLGRMSANDMADADREGEATVSSCVERGPVTNRGFGYWESCQVKVVWEGTEIEGMTIGVVFNSADIGKTVRVGDLGYNRSSRQLARADVAPRPWLEWIGYGFGALAMLPTLVGVLLMREVLRFRRKR